MLLGNGFLPMFASGGTPAPPAFLPSDLANLWAWWDVATLSTLYQDSAGTTPVTTNGDPIGYISDRSGNGRYVRQTGATTTRPTYTTGAQNGLAGALFDGGDYLDSVATTNSFPLTIIGVALTSATVGTNRGVASCYHSTNFGSRVTLGTANTVVSRIETPVTSRLGTVTIGATTPAIFGARFNTTESATITNSEIVTGSHGASVVANIVALGRSSVNVTSTLMNGHICEVVIYNRALTDAEIGQLSTYLNSKWGVY